jgi:DNA-binding transcriptional regulator LsrR (DeoR family)
VNAERTDWKFLTNHGLALICIAGDPGIRLRDIADSIGITERSAHRIVNELVESGYVGRERNGRRNSYEVRIDLPISLALERDLQLGDLLGAVFSTREQAAAKS